MVNFIEELGKNETWFTDRMWNEALDKEKRKKKKDFVSYKIYRENVLKKVISLCREEILEWLDEMRKSNLQYNISVDEFNSRMETKINEVFGEKNWS